MNILFEGTGSGTSSSCAIFGFAMYVGFGYAIYLGFGCAKVFKITAKHSWLCHLSGVPCLVVPVYSKSPQNIVGCAICITRVPNLVVSYIWGLVVPMYSKSLHHF